MTLLLFFLSKSLGSHAISSQTEPWVAFGLPYQLIELFYIDQYACGADGRVEVMSRDYQNFSDG